MHILAVDSVDIFMHVLDVHIFMHILDVDISKHISVDHMYIYIYICIWSVTVLFLCVLSFWLTMVGLAKPFVPSGASFGERSEPRQAERAKACGCTRSYR